MSGKSEKVALNPHTNRNHPRIQWNAELNAFQLKSEHPNVPPMIWDDDKGAWFPMFTDDLVTSQQSVYAVPVNPNPPKPDIPSTNFVPEGSAQQKSGKAKSRKAAAASSQPVIRISESSVYITGLPPDVTLEELEQYFSKCGIILPDFETKKPRIKIYRDPESNVAKGDALLTFYKPESVSLAITLLDDSDLRPGCRIRVDKADFSQKEDEFKKSGEKASSQSQSAATGLNFKKQHDKRKMQEHVKNLEKHLNWEEEAPTRKAKKWARTVILRHMFYPKELEKDPSMILELKEEVREECERVGEVTNVVLYEDHPDGIMTIRYRDPISAQACVKLNHGRFFSGRQVIAYIYDGQEKFQTNRKETEEEQRERLEKYARWLEAGGEGPRPDDEMSSSSENEDVNTQADDDDLEEHQHAVLAKNVKKSAASTSVHNVIEEEEDDEEEEGDDSEHYHTKKKLRHD